MLTFTEIIYSLEYNALVTENKAVQLIILTILSLLLHSNVQFSHL